MKTRFLVAAAAAVALSTGAAYAQPAHVKAAVADKGRPAADVDLDDERKPAEMLAFAEVRPGSKVADFIPGGGYFTRIFSKAVGPKGKVYAITNPPPPNATATPPIVTIAADKAQYGNVEVISTGVGSFKTPEPVDVFWTSQNYHDLYLTRLNVNVPGALKSIYDSIKPGGLFIVLDHAANAGAPVVETANTLHRIDPAEVRKTVEAAGFRYVGESRVLRNPGDDHTKGVFDPSIRRKTDQFIYKFRKPR
jgi:predicted methyltransferase